MAGANFLIFEACESAFSLYMFSLVRIDPPSPKVPEFKDEASPESLGDFGSAVDGLAISGFQ